MVGDFSAKFGNDNKGHEEIMGQHGSGEMNHNGERFAHLCALSNLIIGRGVFQHKRIDKATWVSPHLSTENRTDHVRTGRKLKRSLQTVCMKQGVDVPSDHNLPAAELKLKLNKNWTGDRSQCLQYNTTMLLKDTTTQQEFKIVLLNKFQVLEMLLDKETIKEKWQTIKASFTSTCKEVLGLKKKKKKKKQHHKDLISTETLKKIEERKRKEVEINNSRTRVEKARAYEEYPHASKTAKKSIKAD